MKIIYLAANDKYFYSHRLPMVRAAVRAGLTPVVVARISDHKEKIEAEGIRVIPWTSFRKKGLNPIGAVKTICELTKIYRSERPDLVHHTALQPILFGSIAAYLAKVPHVLNGFTGLGVIFRSNIPLARLLRPFLIPVFRFLFRRHGFWLLFQNPDDLSTMDRLGLVTKDRVEIVRGSGVALQDYTVAPLPQTPPFICAFAGRMIDSKGLPTMYEAFELLRTSSPQIHLWLCGAPDEGNPRSWNETRLNEWCKGNPCVKWLGVQDMASIWPQVHLALQPSWGGEGLPKAALEAAASGRAIIASDIPGCREIVEDGRNGYLVPAENGKALSDAISSIANDIQKCTRMAHESRMIVEGDLSADAVSVAIEAMYRKIIL